MTTEKCPRCWIGDLQALEATYSRIVENELFCMPHAPAWRCDICSFQTWDENLIEMMEVAFPSPEDSTPSYQNRADE